MEARNFIPELVKFISARHGCAVGLIGSRAEGLTHPVTFDFICLHDGEFVTGATSPAGFEAPWGRPPETLPGQRNVELFSADGRPVMLLHHRNGELAEEVDRLLAGELPTAADALAPPTAILRALQKVHPLEDGELKLTGFKKMTADYPGPLRREVLRRSLAVLTALPRRLDGRRESGDAPFLSAVVRGGTAALVEGLFALNREYYAGPRRLLRLVEAFELAPPRVVQDLHRLVSAADRAVELKEKLPLLERQAEVFTRLAESEVEGIREAGSEDGGKETPGIA